MTLYVIQQEPSQSQNGEDGAEVPLIKQFSGVGIKVSFTGNQVSNIQIQIPDDMFS